MAGIILGEHTHIQADEVDADILVKGIAPQAFSLVRESWTDRGLSVVQK